MTGFQNRSYPMPYREDVRIPRGGALTTYTLLVASRRPLESRVLTLEIHDSSPEVAVLLCRGRIVHGDGADELLRAVMSQDKPYIHIDLSAVNAIDAGGLGVLAALERWARDTHRMIQLTNPTARVREALESTGLNSVLNVGLAAQKCGDAA